MPGQTSKSDKACGCAEQLPVKMSARIFTERGSRGAKLLCQVEGETPPSRYVGIDIPYWVFFVAGAFLALEDDVPPPSKFSKNT